MKKGVLTMLLIPAGLSAVGGAIGAAAADRHPAVGAAVGAAVGTSLLWSAMVLFAGGFEEEPKQVGASGASIALGAVGGFP